MTNDDLAQLVDTSDEWIQERTGIRERRFAAQERGAERHRAAGRARGARRSGSGPVRDRPVICATVTPDMLFPTTSALMADTLGMKNAAAFDLLAGCTGFMYGDLPGIRHARVGPLEEGARRRRRPALEDPRLGRPLDARPLRRRRRRGRDGTGREAAASSASSSARTAPAASTSATRAAAPGTSTIPHSILKMNGREVFKFATRVMVSSAEAVLEQCGKTIDDIDVYVPHQANKRIIDYAVGKLGIPPERDDRECRPVREHVVGVDPARTGGCARGRPAHRRCARVDDRNGRRPHVGLGVDRMERHAGRRQSNLGRAEDDGKDRFLLPGPGRSRGWHGT